MSENSPSPSPEITSHAVLQDAAMSPARKYALLAVGSPSFGALLKYELITGLCQGLPGALGLVARQKLYPFLLGALGRGSTIGRNVTLRGASRIIIGRNVHIEDGCTLDARGTEACIKIHDNVMVSRNSILRARDGLLEIGRGSDIGANALLATDSKLVIGEEVLVAAYVYLCAGGNHTHSDATVPVIRQGQTSKGGIRVGNGCWIGAHSSVFDGVEIGEHTIVGAHSMVNRSLGPRKTCFGAPAREVRDRG